MRPLSLLILFSLVAYFSARDLFAAESWVLNRDHSELHFQVPYLQVGSVSGRFKELKGSVELESSRPQSLSVQIKVRSIDSGNTLRDGHLKAHDFLYEKKYPEILFRSRAIEAIGEGRYLARGELLLRGRTHAVDFPFTLSAQLKDSWGRSVRFAHFEAKLSRDKLGLRWNKTIPGDAFLVGDEVVLKGQFQLQPRGAETESSKHMIPDTPAMRQAERLLQEGKAPTGVVPREEAEASLQRHREALPPSSAGEAPASPEAAPAPLSLTWWFAFWTLGLLGFCASVVLGLGAKRWLMDAMGESYTETNLRGYLSDLLVIGFVMLYAVCFFVVGWGH